MTKDVTKTTETMQEVQDATKVIKDTTKTTETKKENTTMKTIKKETLTIQEQLDSIDEQASAAARELQAALKTDSVSAINAAREKAKKLVNEHAALFLTATYEKMHEDDEPLFAMLKKGFVMIRDIKESQTKTGVQVELGYTSHQLTIEELQAISPDRKITAKGNWADCIEKLCMLFSARATHDITGDASELVNKYKMHERARSLDLGGAKYDKREKDPISNRSLTDAMQAAVDAIFFLPVEGKPFNQLHTTTKDVAYLLYTLFRRKSELTVSMPRKKTMTNTVTEVMYKLVNGLDYSADYETIEEKSA